MLREQGLFEAKKVAEMPEKANQQPFLLFIVGVVFLLEDELLCDEIERNESDDANNGNLKLVVILADSFYELVFWNERMHPPTKGSEDAIPDASTESCVTEEHKEIHL